MLHRHVGVVKVIISGSLCSVMVSTLARITRDVGLIHAAWLGVVTVIISGSLGGVMVSELTRKTRVVGSIPAIVNTPRHMCIWVHVHSYTEETHLYRQPPPLSPTRARMS